MLAMFGYGRLWSLTASLVTGREIQNFIKNSKFCKKFIQNSKYKIQKNTVSPTLIIIHMTTLSISVIWQLTVVEEVVW